MTRYLDCKCNGCNARLMIKKGAELKCDYCGSVDLTVQTEFDKDVGIGVSE